MAAPQYGLYRGLAVQILHRFFERPDCRVCGGDARVLAGECSACRGTGKERDYVAYTKLGYLGGPRAGTSEVVRSDAVDPV